MVNRGKIGAIRGRGTDLESVGSSLSSPFSVKGAQRWALEGIGQGAGRC